MNAPAGLRPRVCRTILLIALLGWMLAGQPAAEAHRLDECLQAARIAVEENRVDVELDLTPGAETAAKLLALIDLDRDGRISVLEGEAYSDLVVAALTLKVDGRRTRLALAGTGEFPSPDEIKAGVGMIRLSLSAERPTFRVGKHRLFFCNRHQPDLSVYLVNALVPSSKRIEVTHQERDPSQREFQLEFTVR